MIWISRRKDDRTKKLIQKSFKDNIEEVKLWLSPFIDNGKRRFKIYQKRKQILKIKGYEYLDELKEVYEAIKELLGI